MGLPLFIDISYSSDSHQEWDVRTTRTQPITSNTTCLHQVNLPGRAHLPLPRICSFLPPFYRHPAGWTLFQGKWCPPKWRPPENNVREFPLIRPKPVHPFSVFCTASFWHRLQPVFRNNLRQNQPVTVFWAREKKEKWGLNVGSSLNCDVRLPSHRASRRILFGFDARQRAQLPVFALPAMSSAKPYEAFCA